MCRSMRPRAQASRSWSASSCKRQNGSSTSTRHRRSWSSSVPSGTPTGTSGGACTSGNASACLCTGRWWRQRKGSPPFSSALTTRRGRSPSRSRSPRWTRSSRRLRPAPGPTEPGGALRPVSSPSNIAWNYMKKILAKTIEKGIAAALKPLRFQMQVGMNDVTFVRPSATTTGLFERVECMDVGQRIIGWLLRLDTIVLSVALSVVHHTAVQLRGLFQRDGWPELCTDRGGRVELQSRGEMTEWLVQLVDRAPERFERLVREKGDTLLARTKEARERAGVVANTIDRSALADALREPFPEPFAGLTGEETKLAKALMEIPYVVSSDSFEELWSVYGVAIAALIRAGDDAIAQSVNAPHLSTRTSPFKSVPEDLHWRIRLLVDRILIWRDESWLCKDY